MAEAWIIDAARTPRGIGKANKGSLSAIHPQRLLATVLAALAERNDLDVNHVDDVIAGCATQVGRQGSCIARMAALDAGWPESVPGVSLDRFCGSGLTAINIGAMGIFSGMQQMIVAGGVESMSYTASLQPLTTGLLDSDNLHLRQLHPQPHQGICADLIASLEGFTRSDLDALALESQRRAAHAIDNGYFERALVPVHHDDGSVALAAEEFPRPGTTLEALAQLKPSFASIYDFPLDDEALSNRRLVEQTYPGVGIEHVHHAGNSSGVVDGAAAIVLASPEYAKSHGLKPRARIRAVATAAASPELMLTAPGPAIDKALAIAGLSIADIELFEINEAFAAIPLKVMRDARIDPAIVNVNGGAIALGHPIGATGAILVGTLLDEMERRGATLGLATLCAGGGMAPAIIVERI